MIPSFQTMAPRNSFLHPLLPLLLLSFCTICISISISSASNLLTTNQTLSGDQKLTSEGDNFVLGFFTTTNTSSKFYIGIWYSKVSKLKRVKPVWVANRDTPVSDTNSSVLQISQDGNLVLLDQGKSLKWSTNATISSNSTVAVLGDDGNLVLRDLYNSSKVLWQSIENPTDTWLPGGKIGFNKVTGVSQKLTSWKNSENPAPGIFSMEIDPVGSQYLLKWNGTKPYWNTGTWMTDYLYNFYYVRNSQENYFNYSFSTTVISRFILDVSGQIKMLNWVDTKQEWTLFWVQPQNQCQVIRLCGPFGTCNEETDQYCSCLEGFSPKSREDWSLSDYSGGCNRNVQLQCGGNNKTNYVEPDKFLQISSMRLPEDIGQSLQVGSAADCEQTCLRNCSCTAYSYGTGCLLWFGQLFGLQENYDGGQDLYYRLVASELNPISDHKKKRSVLVIILSVAGSIVVLLPCVAILYLNCGKALGKKLTSPELSSNPGLPKLFGDAMMHGEGNKGCPHVSFAKIKLATENFCDSNKLGAGGFGPVYKGMLEGQNIAVKRLARNSGQGIREFKNEITLIANLQHRNLVRLLGCCIEEEEKILIYEYLPNKSLDTYIFDTIRGAELDWQKRFHTIEGIAQGLLYLHKFSRLKVIHRDLKTSNILLDSEMNPKISDFGLARIFAQNENQANTRRVVGTYGYMSPEYAMEGLFSVKSDIYSFGVMLLEIVSGKKNTAFQPSDSTLNLLGYAWELWTEGRSMEFVDPILGDQYPPQEVSRCIHVALLCFQDHAADRPTISAVISMLHNETSLPFPKQPAFYVVRDESSSSVKLEICTINNASFTSIHGR